MRIEFKTQLLNASGTNFDSDGEVFFRLVHKNVDGVKRDFIFREPLLLDRKTVKSEEWANGTWKFKVLDLCIEKIIPSMLKQVKALIESSEFCKAPSKWYIN